MEKSDIISSVRSDHSAILLHIRSNFSKTRGSNFWKFNNSLLEDNNYIKVIRQNMKHWIMPDIKNKRVQWELIKYYIRKMTIDYCKSKQKVQRDLEKNLNQTLNEIDVKISEKPSIELMEKRNQLCETIKKIENQKIKGAAIRAKDLWYEEGEKSSKYFFSLEKKNAIKSYVRKLYNEKTKKIECNPFRVLEIQKQFYSNLYSKKESNKTQVNYFLNGNIKKLSEMEKKFCEKELTPDGLKEALDTFKKNKTPGNDGITVEFYQFFGEDLRMYFFDSCKETFDIGELTTSQKQAIIKLLEKKGKDRTYIKNWRPISLLNVDYKIISKALAIKLKKVLPSIISVNQSGYVEDRFIGDSVCTISDIMYYTKEQQIPGILLCIDFEKAFDSVSWDYLFATLDAFNFGNYFKKWIKILYTGISSCVMNNGRTSQYFDIERGVRQGDPLSAYLFILVTETLTAAINEEKNIKGFKMFEKEIKLVLYADDTTAFLKDKESVLKMLEIMDKFKKCSGLSINVDKTEAMSIGNSIEEGTDFDFKWKKNINILGIHFSYDETEMFNVNYNEQLKKMEKTLNLWKMRDLSLMGRIMITKSVALSKFIYLGSIIGITDDIADKIEKQIYSFIWKNKKARIKKTTLIGKYEEGGLQAPHIQSVFKAHKLMWIKKYLDCNYKLWHETLNYYLNDYGKTFFCHCNYKSNALEKRIPPFYAQCIDEWQKYIKIVNYRQTPDTQFIWNNEKIQINHQTVYAEDFREIGIWTFTDLFDNNKLKTFEYFITKGINPSRYMFWRGLVDAIPRKIKIAIKSNDYVSGCSSLNVGPQKAVNKAKSRDFYIILVKEKFIKPTSQKYYSTTDTNWTKIYRLPFEVCHDTKSRDFQYRFIHHIIPTNEFLHKIGKIENNLCRYCKQEIENVNHLFYSCKYIQIFWQSVSNNILHVFNIKHLKLENVLYGMIDKDTDVLVNQILILAKQYIIQTKMYQTVSITTFIQKVKELYFIERRTAKKGEKQIEKKWNKLQRLLLT
ncbi:MAG: hypothetical protein GY702_08215 [Desulfobulbaceae bacterium]|nr:hypothetical protein [Desulfobulbaceae bacterium]